MIVDVLLFTVCACRWNVPTAQFLTVLHAAAGLTMLHDRMNSEEC